MKGWSYDGKRMTCPHGESTRLPEHIEGILRDALDEESLRERIEALAKEWEQIGGERYASFAERLREATNPPLPLTTEVEGDRVVAEPKRTEDDGTDVGYATLPTACVKCGATVTKNGPCPGGCGYSY